MGGWVGNYVGDRAEHGARVDGWIGREGGVRGGEVGGWVGEWEGCGC